MRLEDALAVARKSGGKVWHIVHGLPLHMDMGTLLREDYEVVEEPHKPCAHCGGAAWDRRTP